jgi:ABC-type tungstate transport system substrate-binding protein
MLVVFGLAIAAVGLFFMLAGKANLHLGRLPGDISYRRGNFTFYLPLGTSILLSILLSIVLWFLNRR